MEITTIAIVECMQGLYRESFVVFRASEICRVRVMRGFRPRFRGLCSNDYYTDFSAARE